MAASIHIDYHDPDFDAVRCFYERCRVIHALSRNRVVAKYLQLVLKSRNDEGAEVDVYVSFAALARALNLPVDSLYPVFTYTNVHPDTRIATMYIPPDGCDLNEFLEVAEVPGQAGHFMLLSSALGKPVTVCRRDSNANGDETYLPAYTVSMTLHK